MSREGLEISPSGQIPPPASTAAAAADPLRQPLAVRAFPTPGGMDCAKGTAVAGLYDDLMVDILSRVPVKDVRRSKCVSKPWRDLIADPLHRKKLPHTLEGFFHGGAGEHDSYGHFTTLSGRGESAPPVDPSFSFLTSNLPGVERIVLLDSCNGLLLFGCYREDRSVGYVVCNPATEELVTVPASSGSCPPPPEHPLVKESYAYGAKRYAHTSLMFDPVVSSQFHLFQFWSKSKLEMVQSYSSETRAWSDRSSKWEQGEEGGKWGLWGKAIIRFMYGRTLLNGLLHFVAYHVQKKNMIVAVDGDAKICRIICWPVNHFLTEAAFVGQSQGHLHCIGINVQFPDSIILHFTQLSVWVLEDYDTQEWILKHNVSCSQLFGSLSFPIENYNIVAIHPDHNSIILVQHSNQKLLSYNLDSKELRAICTLGEGYRFITPYVPCFIESPVLATKN